MNLEQLLDTDGLPDTLDQLGRFIIENPHEYAGVPIFFFLQAINEGLTARAALEEAKKNFGGDSVPVGGDSCA